MLSSRDKLWHFLASLGMVWLFYAALTIVNRLVCFSTSSENNDDSQSDDEEINDHVVNITTTTTATHQNHQAEAAAAAENHNKDIFWKHFLQSQWCRIILSSFVSLLVGTIKEIADAMWNGWPWCNNGVCHADGWDFLANLIGILIGASSLALMVLMIGKLSR